VAIRLERLAAHLRKLGLAEEAAVARLGAVTLAAVARERDGLAATAAAASPRSGVDDGR
jgi:hypothetical protein